VQGEVLLHRLFDVGYEVRLDQAAELLASSAPQRPRPVRVQARAIQIMNPPVAVSLGGQSIEVGADTCAIELSARIFDFGVISLRARVHAPRGLTWGEFAAFGSSIVSGELSTAAWGRLATARDSLLARIHPAIERPSLSLVTEEYTVFRIFSLEDAAGAPLPLEQLTGEQIASLLLGETRPVSPAARAEMLSPRLAYFDDDLTVLSWNAALVVEPVREDTDVQYVLEFANAQLLELRYYDSLLDAELPHMYDEVSAARRAFHLLGRRFSRLLSALQQRVAEATESIERVENSLKVTDDIFLARIYTTALDTFRVATWRAGIDRKMTIVRETYSMLNAESQALRSEALELTIILLILMEILMAVFSP